MKPPLEILFTEQIAEAREKKRRAKLRLRALAGDAVSTPSRGPRQSNGRNCHRFLFWQRAVANHEGATQKVKALAKVFRYLETGDRYLAPNAPPPPTAEQMKTWG